MSNLHQKTLVALLMLFFVMATLIFIPAWTFAYWQAWTFLAVYFIGCAAITLYLMKQDPQLLSRRMSGGPWAEKQPTQQIIMSLTSVGYIGLIVIAALDHRFAWSHLPPWVALAGDALVALGFLGVFFVFRENSFTSATIELAPDQKVISTGPYAWVRHPMYAAGLVLLGAVPIALGSLWGVLVFVAIVPALLWRLFDEEKFLARNLRGYAEYQDEVRYRLIPGVF
jgi:protein-S-isoprenylcysteine O-methyltransferase Ste14